jgi:hypothetical protein
MTRRQALTIVGVTAGFLYVSCLVSLYPNIQDRRPSPPKRSEYAAPRSPDLYVNPGSGRIEAFPFVPVGP